MQYDLFATVPKGLESQLLKELKSLGAEKIRKVRAGVSFRGDLETAYRSCLWSRLASRVLLQLQALAVNNEDDLYRACYDFPWEEHFAADRTFAVDATLVDAPLNHSHYAALKIKDAIVDRFRDRTGLRPSVDTRSPDLRINFHLRKKEGSLALDLSGDSLHRRGYRQDAGEAPLKENLAAALLLQAGWPEIAGQGGVFCDPMCGSGTLPIEAALIAADIAPGLLRTAGLKREPRYPSAGWKINPFGNVDYGRRVVLAEAEGTQTTVRAIRDKKDVLMQNQDGKVALYDLKADPEQRTDLAEGEGRAAQETKIRELQALMPIP